MATGTLIANWLFCTTNTAGTCQTPAKLNASCVSPSLDAPSPTKVSAAIGSPLSFAAFATPTACSACVASGVAWMLVLCFIGS